MDRDDIKKDLEDQVNRLSQAASAATDLCLIAKAIAAADQAVQDKIIAYSNLGYRPQGIRCLGATQYRDQREVLFAFANRPNTIALVPTAFLAVVHIPQRRVSHIIDPYVEGEPAALGALPYAVAVPSNAPNVAVDLQQLSPRFEQEASFFSAHGLTPINPHSTCTVTCPHGTVDYCSQPTPQGTASMSGHPPRPDDSTTDYHSDTVTDSKTDYPTELVQDD